MMMMPLYAGAPWVPKYTGPSGSLQYGDWKEQIQGLLGIQEFSEAKKVEIVLGALGGEAKQQVGVLVEDERDRVAKIFTYLDALYGEQTSIPALRAHFYNCYQKPRETVKAYLLRLRGLYCRLQRRSPDDAPTENNLREQFLLGLEDGALAQDLKTYARRNPGRSFDDLRQEAMLLDDEHGGERLTGVECSAVREAQAAKPLTSERDWKRAFKDEIMAEVAGQMKGLTQEIVRELRPLLEPRQPNHPIYAPPVGGRRRATSDCSNRWDTEGRPICRRCKQPGHVARFCRATSETRPALN